MEKVKRDGYLVRVATVMHVDGCRLCEGTQDVVDVAAHHTLIDGGNWTEMGVPPREGVWYSREFESHADALAFVERRIQYGVSRIPVLDTPLS